MLILLFIPYGLLFCWIPFVFPYKFVCKNCSNRFTNKTPSFANFRVNTVLKVLLALLPTLLMFYILIELFPYTGLGRIVALPFIFIINLTIISLGFIITRNLKRHRYFMAWFGIILLTMFISTALYPQESRPHVFVQMGYGFSAIKQYDQALSTDLDLVLSTNSKRDVKNPEERYVVALYKYRDQIPLDGTYHIYRDNENGSIPYWRNTIVNSLDEIPSRLIGHHKVIWWVLKICRK
ncbi:hypothetical protein [Paenibacillus sedimenti]|uniref:Uncharacterized protein n=1 Tax=Paenibacillus sedimenti TaxID=2770274 RepID=A0A926KXK6_9BACL|nr:hypothetical protein [Paenibacillus sedimenti]MBD0384696.1 hypothetical protein [Paenibacillus sedimenti]